MNTKKGHTPEYIDALHFLTTAYTLSILPPWLLDLRESRIDQWLESFEYIYQRYSEEKLKLKMALTIYNLGNALLENGYLEEADKALEGLRYFCQRFSEIEFQVMLSRCLRFTTKHYAENRLLKGAVEYLKELKQLYQKYPNEMSEYLEFGSMIYFLYLGRNRSESLTDELEELSKIGKTHLNEYLKNHIPSFHKLNDYEVNELVQEEQELLATAVKHEMYTFNGDIC